MNRCDYLDPGAGLDRRQGLRARLRAERSGLRAAHPAEVIPPAHDFGVMIGLLQCDHVADEFQAILGDYDAMFRRWLPAEWRVYDLTAGEFPGPHRLRRLGDHGIAAFGLRRRGVDPPVRRAGPARFIRKHDRFWVCASAIR